MGGLRPLRPRRGEDPCVPRLENRGHGNPDLDPASLRLCFTSSGTGTPKDDRRTSCKTKRGGRRGPRSSMRGPRGRCSPHMAYSTPSSMRTGLALRPSRADERQASGT